MAEQAYIHTDGITRVVNLRVASYDRYIGRPSQWGNPFEIGKHGTRDQVIDRYLDWLYTQPQLLDQLVALKGCTLGCFCAPKRCHGDILAELANSL